MDVFSRLDPSDWSKREAVALASNSEWRQRLGDDGGRRSKYPPPLMFVARHAGVVVQALPARLHWLEALPADDDVFTSRFEIPVVEGRWVSRTPWREQSRAPGVGPATLVVRICSSTTFTVRSSGSACFRARHG